MTANEQFDFYNPDSMYYANSKHYIAQLEAMSRQQQAEIEVLKHQVTGLKLSWQCETDIVEKQQALIEEQDKKIIELAFRAVYAERSNEVVKELSK